MPQAEVCNMWVQIPPHVEDDEEEYEDEEDAASEEFDEEEEEELAHIVVAGICSDTLHNCTANSDLCTHLVGTAILVRGTQLHLC